MTHDEERRRSPRRTPRQARFAAAVERLEARWARAVDLAPPGDGGADGDGPTDGDDLLVTTAVAAAPAVRTVALGVLRRPLERPVAAGATAQWFTFRTQGTGGPRDRIVLTGRGLVTGELSLELLAEAGPARSMIPLAESRVQVALGIAATKQPSQVSLAGVPAGRYLLRVSVTNPLNGAAALPAGLGLRFDAPARDGRASGGDDTPETARAIGTSKPGRGLRVQGRIDDAADWVAFDVPAAGPRSITFRHQAPPRAFSLVEITDASGMVLGRSSGPGSVQAIRGLDLAPGRHLVRVTQQVGGKASIRVAHPYTLRVVVDPSPPAAAAARAAATDQAAAFIDALPAQALRPLLSAARDGDRVVLDRSDMLEIFDAVEADGVVTAKEFRALGRIVRDDTVVAMPDSVRNLAHKTVLGNRANATFQGQPLGNLRAGSPATVLADLVDKWFLGGDPPLSAVDKTTGLPTYQTATATGSLFGSGGPTVDDIAQGDTGDCYFLSSLGTVVSRMGQPGGANVIALATPDNPHGMFIDNGDGTYTVRLHHKARHGSAAGTWVPDYVTVNNEFLTVSNAGTPEWLYANAYGVFDDPATVLWVAYAEKAFVQMNTTGVWGRSSIANDYEAINGTYDANVMLMAITGRDGYHDSQDLSSMTFDHVADAYDRGVGVVFGSLASNVPADSGETAADVPIVENHDYMMVGYDRDAGTILLRNPWGDAVNADGYTGVRGTYDAVSGTSDEPGYTSLLVTATVPFLRKNYAAWYHV